MRHLYRHIGANAFGMSPPGRPKGEYRNAQHGGYEVSPPGRPRGGYRNAQHGGLVSLGGE